MCDRRFMISLHILPLRGAKQLRKSAMRYNQLGNGEHTQTKKLLKKVIQGTMIRIWR